MYHNTLFEMAGWVVDQNLKGTPIVGSSAPNSWDLVTCKGNTLHRLGVLFEAVDEMCDSSKHGEKRCRRTAAHSSLYTPNFITSKPNPHPTTSGTGFQDCAHFHCN